MEQRKPVRVLVNGCYDFYHFGHANLFRRAKEQGDVLIVGVVSDADVEKHKGPTIMNDRERSVLVHG